MPARPSVEIIQTLKNISVAPTVYPRQSCIIGPKYNLNDVGNIYLRDITQSTNNIDIPISSLNIASNETLDTDSIKISAQINSLYLGELTTPTATASNSITFEAPLPADLQIGDKIVVDGNSYIIISIDTAAYKVGLPDSVTTTANSIIAFIRETSYSVDCTFDLSINPLIISNIITSDNAKIYSATFTIHFRALTSADAYKVIHVTSISDITSFVGEISFENDLALSAYINMSATASSLYIMSIPSLADANYIQALSVLEDYPIQAISCLTTSDTVNTGLLSHVAKMSQMKRHRWRRGYIASQIDTTIEALVTSQLNGTTEIMVAPFTGTLSAGTITTTDTTKFISGPMPVVTGDLVLIDGNTYVISAINSDTKLEITDLQTSYTSVSMTITHIYTKDEIVAIQEAKAKSFNSNRIIRVFAGDVGYSLNSVSQQISPVYAAAVAATIDTSLPPQHGLTNIAFPFESVSLTSFYFSHDQLDIISDGGNFILMQDMIGGPVIVRQALTTNMSEGLLGQEVMETRITDAVSQYLFDIFKDYPKEYNITPSLINIVIPQTYNLSIMELKKQVIPRYGAIISGATLDKISQPTEDSIYMHIIVTQPKPLNKFSIELFIQ